MTLIECKTREKVLRLPPSHSISLTRTITFKKKAPSTYLKTIRRSSTFRCTGTTRAPSSPAATTPTRTGSASAVAPASTQTSPGTPAAAREASATPPICPPSGKWSCRSRHSSIRIWLVVPQSCTLYIRRLPLARCWGSLESDSGPNDPPGISFSQSYYRYWCLRVSTLQWVTPWASAA